MAMNIEQPHRIFNQEYLERIFPQQRSTDFFEALYGDADDAAFDIKLAFVGVTGDHLNFQFLLIQRPAKCLACNLTYGLPNVFSRHPVINIRGIISDIASVLNLPSQRLAWKLGQTQPTRQELHAIPLTITIQPE